MGLRRGVGVSGSHLKNCYLAFDRERSCEMFISCSLTAPLPHHPHKSPFDIQPRKKEEKIQVGGEESGRRRLGNEMDSCVFFCRRKHRELFGGGCHFLVPPLSCIDTLFSWGGVYEGIFRNFFAASKVLVGRKGLVVNAICFMLIRGDIYLWTLRWPV